MPTFNNIFAIDPTDLTKVAANAEVTIFAPGDETRTPLAITDVTGLSLPNPITTSEFGFGPAFIADLDQVAWEGGGLSNVMESYSAVREIAVAAQAEAALSAQEAESSRVAAEAAGVDAGVSAAAQVALELGATRDAAQASAASADAAAESAAASAALVGAPSDTVVKTLIEGDTQTKTALSAAIVEQTPPIVEAVMGPVVDGLVAEAIAADPTVANAAAAAVDANPKIAQIESKADSHEARINVDESHARELRENGPIPTPGGFKVRDTSGATALEVTDDGNLGVGAARFEQLPEGLGVAFRVRDKTGAVAFAILADGTQASGSESVSEVHIFIGAGQSNMSGRGTPVGEDFDPSDSRIFQYGSGATSMTLATVPLDMHDSPAGLSPLTAFAREYARTIPPSTVLLLVPAAHGGTGFTTAAPLTWDSTTVGGLYDQMIDQTISAMSAAQSLWGVVPTLKALLWHQGEADGVLTTEAYAGHLDALIGSARADLSEPNLAVVVGQMSSDWVAQNEGPLRVQEAHMDTPARVVRTAFAASLPNTGREGDLVHFGRAGVEHLGKSMFEALPAALANDAAVLVMPPTRLQAIKAAGIVKAYWDAPLCRATGYTIEYRIGAGAWTLVTGRTIAVNREQELPANATEVRVATIGESAASRFTQPTPVQGA